ncbi:MAG TPA: type VII secretion-associated serine protease mycosin [Pseudonocardiaceae bacterium]|nr:type VII secretion-associated serine protease mycosin [Pseudonocardiaceae bacterium]
MIRITAARRRVAATAVSALLVLLGPAAWPAWADSTTTTDPNNQVGPEFWTPPPINYSAYLPPLPPPGGAPDRPYAPASNQQCVSSGVGPVTSVQNVPAAQSMLDIDDAQKVGDDGAGVTVAVIDTGVNQHPFLTDNGRLRNGGDYITNSGDARNDCDGHGTIVAGIIAANTSQSSIPVGFKGVAPQANILAIKQTSSRYQAQNGNSTVTAGDLTTLASAIFYAAHQPDVKVITMSVDECIPATPAALQVIYGQQQFKQLQAAIHYAVNTADKVVIAAAGNISSGGGNGADQNGQSPCSNVPNNTNPNPNEVNMVEIPPVFADDVLSVASVNPVTSGNAYTSGVSSFSVWGPWVSLAAPGENIVSLDPAANGSQLSNQTTENNQTIPLQGTSFAAPYVAGVAALVRKKFPTMSARQVMQRLEATAQHPSGGADGRNSAVGYGVIDPMAALTAAMPGENGVPPENGVNIPAALPAANVQDPVPLLVALIGTAAGVVIFVVVAFTVRARRRNETTR